MANFSCNLSDWLTLDFDREWLEANVRWKDFGTGVRLGRLAREDNTSLVLYDADAEVEVEAFQPHMHPGGEVYLVLSGEVYDEFGTYPAGSIVWMDPGTEHNPKTRERTLILVLWPDGVKIIT
jgi:anti-sigma factor ChrR (cupin superfamily)